MNMLTTMQMPQTTFNPNLAGAGVNGHNRVADVLPGLTPHAVGFNAVPTAYGQTVTGYPQDIYGNPYVSGINPAAATQVGYPTVHPSLSLYGQVQTPTFGLPFGQIPQTINPWANPYVNTLNPYATQQINPFVGVNPYQTLGTLPFAGIPTVSPFAAIQSSFVSPLTSPFATIPQTFGLGTINPIVAQQTAAQIALSVTMNPVAAQQIATISTINPIFAQQFCVTAQINPVVAQQIATLATVNPQIAQQVCTLATVNPIAAQQIATTALVNPLACTTSCTPFGTISPLTTPTTIPSSIHPTLASSWQTTPYLNSFSSPFSVNPITGLPVSSTWPTTGHLNPFWSQWGQSHIPSVIPQLTIGSQAFNPFVSSLTNYANPFIGSTGFANPFISNVSPFTHNSWATPFQMSSILGRTSTLPFSCATPFGIC